MISEIAGSLIWSSIGRRKGRITSKLIFHHRRHVQQRAVRQGPRHCWRNVVSRSGEAKVLVRAKPALYLQAGLKISRHRSCSGRVGLSGERPADTHRVAELERRMGDVFFCN
jgi:hypothetical protein